MLLVIDLANLVCRFNVGASNLYLTFTSKRDSVDLWFESFRMVFVILHGNNCIVD